MLKIYVSGLSLILRLSIPFLQCKKQKKKNHEPLRRLLQFLQRSELAGCEVVGEVLLSPKTGLASRARKLMPLRRYSVYRTSMRDWFGKGGGRMCCGEETRGRFFNCTTEQHIRRGNCLYIYMRFLSWASARAINFGSLTIRWLYLQASTTWISDLPCHWTSERRHYMGKDLAVSAFCDREVIGSV